MTSDHRPTSQNVQEAYGLLRHHVTQTPIIVHPTFQSASGTSLRIKAECLQQTGSFKYRGARYACMKAAEQGATSVLAYSSGNHAQGIARAARQLGMKATIIMPHDAPALKMQRVRDDGAELITYQRGVESREDLGAEHAKKTGAVLIKPYDEPHVIMGQGSLGLELCQQLDEPHDIIVCCGGGGLTAGVALALDGSGHRLWLAEPAGFDDWKRSLETQTRQSNDKEYGSICDAIMTPTPGEITFDIVKTRASGGFAVSEQEVCEAMRFAWREAKITAEPGGSVALAAALFHIKTDRPVCAVVTGGNADPELFAQIISGTYIPA